METITLDFAKKLARSLNKFRTNAQETVEETLNYIKTQYNVEDSEPKTESLPKQKIWVDSNDAYQIGITVASGTFTGLGGSFLTRKVNNITEDEIYGKRGEVKLNKKTIQVVLDSGNEWRVA